MGNSASRGRQRPRPEQPAQPFAYPPPAQVHGPPQASAQTMGLNSPPSQLTSRLPLLAGSRASLVRPSDYKQWSDVRRVASAIPATKFCGTVFSQFGLPAIFLLSAVILQDKFPCACSLHLTYLSPISQHRHHRS